MVYKPESSKRLSVVDGNDKYLAGVIAPIISAGDTIGSVVFFGSDETPSCSDVEEKLAQSAAAFLGKQMED